MSGSDALDRAEGTDPADAARQSFSAIIFAIAGGISMVIGVFFDGFANVVGRMRDLGEFISAFFLTPIPILEETADFTAFELTAGDWAFFGPFTFTAGVVAIGVAFMAWVWLGAPIPFYGNLFDRFRS